MLHLELSRFNCLHGKNLSKQMSQDGLKCYILKEVQDNQDCKMINFFLNVKFYSKVVELRTVPDIRSITAIPLP